ncbi:MAG: hypothetical protein L6Q83_03070 [Gammaproteobacteria bacterium]|nr:hypothetical protein [Gammaproteobacteria bacterium]
MRRGWLPLALLLACPAAGGQDRGPGPGPDEADDWTDEWSAEPAVGSPWSGFIEIAGGSRFEEDPQVGRRGTLADLRTRLERDWRVEQATASLKADGLYDAIDQEFDLVLREAALAFSPGSRIDVKAGRQVLTWGTGDLLFLNDLFPKDFVSFFAGREDEYLKAPSDTVRLTAWSDIVNLDFAWTPLFEPDDYLTGERFSFFSPAAGRLVAPEPPLGADLPTRSLDNGEFALRLFTTRRGVEYALYGYRGFFKQPSDFRDPAGPGFAPLSALGGSLRRPLAGGLWNAEVSYYFSRDDRAGADPAVPNDQLRLLSGYEREWFANFTVGFQYYLEWTGDHGELIANSPWPQFEPEERRQLATLRVSWRTRQDALRWSLFAFWSPTDHDYHLRPALTWRHSDAWTFTAGANLFGGQDLDTFFGQLEDNQNAYLRVRRHF